MNIVMVASECYPYAKTGGMADVVSDLSRVLQLMGHNVSIVMPFYSVTETYLKQKGITRKTLEKDLSIAMDQSAIKGKVVSWDNEHGCSFFAIQQDGYYFREGLYGDAHGDYRDNAQRFSFFSHAVVALIEKGWVSCDVLHCHDWQSALVPLLMRCRQKKEKVYPRTLLTIHNLAYQGVFVKEDLRWVGSNELMKTLLTFYNKINFLKAGLLAADGLNTVSPQYVKEIQEESFGHGLHAVMQHRSQNLWGILNGIAMDVWSTQQDSGIFTNFDTSSLEHKQDNKSFLLDKAGIKDDGQLLLGMVSRLVTHKGLDILTEAMRNLMDLPVSFIVLGTGESKWHHALSLMDRRYDHFKAFLTYHDRLAHEMYAGIDGFVMPSSFEPCGLTQMMAMRYGAIPLVNGTGGLINTVSAWQDEGPLGKGCVMDAYSSEALVQQVKVMVDLYQDRSTWQSLMIHNMQCDFSWQSSAQKYLVLYRYLVTMD